MNRIELERIKGVRIYRDVSNKFRVLAIRYSGNNVEQIEKFTEMKFLRSTDKSYIKNGNNSIYIGDWVVRDFISPDTEDLGYYVEQEKIFKKKYKKESK